MEVGKSLMEARNTFPGLAIKSEAFRQALASAQEKRAGEQFKANLQMFLAEQKRLDEEAILNAAMKWAINMRKLTSGSGKGKFPDAQWMRAQEIKRDITNDVDEAINLTTLEEGGACRSFGPRFNFAKQLLQQGNIPGYEAQMAILEKEYYTEEKVLNSVFDTTGPFGRGIGVGDKSGVKENVNIKVLDSPLSAIALDALNQAKTKFTKGAQFSRTNEANFITEQASYGWMGREPNWFQWTRNNMPNFVRHLLVSLNDNLREREAKGMLTEDEAAVLENLKAMGNSWNSYADAFVESVLNPAVRRDIGDQRLVDEVLNKAGIRTELFGYVPQNLKSKASQLRNYAEIDTWERGTVLDYAREYPQQLEEYLQLKNSVGMVDEKTNMLYMVNLDALRQAQGQEYEDRMTQTGAALIRDFKAQPMRLLDRLVQYLPAPASPTEDKEETILSYLRDISEANVMGEKERARQILMGKEGEFEGLVDLWFDNENVTADFIADFTEFFYKWGVLESYNPLAVAKLAERYRGIEIFETEEAKEELGKRTQQRYGTGGTALLRFLTRE